MLHVKDVTQAFAFPAQIEKLTMLYRMAIKAVNTREESIFTDGRVNLLDPSLLMAAAVGPANQHDDEYNMVIVLLFWRIALQDPEDLLLSSCS